MELITRSEAVAAGLKRYYTGRPCRYGHTVERSTANASCSECGRIQMALWRDENPARHKITAKRSRDKEYAARTPEKRALIYAGQRRRYRDHPEINRRSQAKWNAKNQHKIKDAGAAYYQRNRQTKDQRSAKWYRDHPEVLNAKNARRRSAKMNATPPWLSKDQRQEIVGFYREARSRTKQTGIEHHVDHIVPLKSDVVCGLHVPWNLQVLTGSENSRKCNNFSMC